MLRITQQATQGRSELVQTFPGVMSQKKLIRFPLVHGIWGDGRWGDRNWTWESRPRSASELEAIAGSRSFPHGLVRHAQMILWSGKGLTVRKVARRTKVTSAAELLELLGS